MIIFKKRHALSKLKKTVFIKTVVSYKITQIYMKKKTETFS